MATSPTPLILGADVIVDASKQTQRTAGLARRAAVGEFIGDGTDDALVFGDAGFDRSAADARRGAGERLLLRSVRRP
ncbi:MAG: hypothetical protein U5R48_14840 [Gammaproteobacteria bacterium]|nr:hypothetical protein [Gammaproteobacteria bacterium]